MKAKKEHVLPLSDRAIVILESLPRDRAKVFGLSNMAMLNLLKGMDANGYTTHGFRSTFSDWVGDCTAYPHDVREMALAHTIKNNAEAAYRRGSALEKRRRLMQDWADYCARPVSAGDKVTPMRGKAS